MRRLFLMVLFLFGIFVFNSTSGYADDLYFQKDTLIPGVIIIKNKYGDKVGTLKKDTLIPGKWILRWKDAKEKRRFSVDTVDMDTYLKGGKR